MTSTQPDPAVPGRWIVCQTKPCQESWAKLNIERQGCETYLPLFRPDARLKSKPRPLFPSYIFVVITGPWYFLRSTFGVLRPVMCSGELTIVPTSIINELRHRQGSDGLVQVPQCRFNHGQRVRVRRGPFADQIGTFAGMSGRERIKVLLGMLSVTIADNLLEAA